MICIDDKIVSEELLTEKFLCDVKVCKGMCCVEGDSGAPLEIDEVDELEENYGSYSQYLTDEGRESIQRNGFMVVDTDGEYTTPLVNGAECAYSFREGDTTFCAIERAYLNGECRFRKPISCHLYPIRARRLSNGMTALNYHRWDVCRSACENGVRLGVPVYRMLKDPICRAWGEEFYEKMCAAHDLLKNKKDK